MDDEEFKQLLEAGNLGAPHVKAALGPLPDTVAKRLRLAVEQADQYPEPQTER